MQSLFHILSAGFLHTNTHIHTDSPLRSYLGPHKVKERRAVPVNITSCGVFFKWLMDYIDLRSNLQGDVQHLDMESVFRDNACKSFPHQPLVLRDSSTKN